MYRHNLWRQISPLPLRCETDSFHFGTQEKEKGASFQIPSRANEIRRMVVRCQRRSNYSRKDYGQPHRYFCAQGVAQHHQRKLHGPGAVWKVKDHLKRELQKPRTAWAFYLTHREKK